MATGNSIQIEVGVGALTEAILQLSEDVRRLTESLDGSHLDEMEELSLPQRVLGLGNPIPGDVSTEWNEAAIRLAIEDEAPVTFEYTKPIHAWDSPGDILPRTRRALPIKFDKVSSNPNNQVMTGIDLDVDESPGVSRIRTFRLDLVNGWIVRASE